MNTLEQTSRSEQMPDFGMEAFGMTGDFDINAAFQEAIQGVAADTELVLEEKIRRMETIISEGTSDVYREFVDFRQMAAQVETMCNHDHAFAQSVSGSEGLSNFLGEHAPGDAHGHAESSHQHTHDDDEYDIDPKTGKKTKKKRRHGWLVLLG